MAHRGHCRRLGATTRPPASSSADEKFWRQYARAHAREVGGYETCEARWIETDRLMPKSLYPIHNPQCPAPVPDRPGSSEIPRPRSRYGAVFVSELGFPGSQWGPRPPIIEYLVSAHGRKGWVRARPPPGQARWPTAPWWPTVGLGAPLGERAE